MTKNYYGSCVNWPEKNIDNLQDIVDNSIQITRRTFLKHVNRDQLREMESDLGYSRHPAQGLTMATDWHVTYHRYKKIYYFCHSAIEYIFK